MVEDESPCGSFDRLRRAWSLGVVHDQRRANSSGTAGDPGAVRVEVGVAPQ